jgi:hypothetical protein
MAPAIALLFPYFRSKNGKIDNNFPARRYGKKRAYLVLAPSCGRSCDGQIDDDVPTRLGNSASGQ